VPGRIIDRRFQDDREPHTGTAAGHGGPVVPQNKLSAAERAEILAALNSREFVDLAPMQVVRQDAGPENLSGSLSTFYRVLEENRMVKERRRLAKHPPRTVPELLATAPGQVCTWDITKLAGPVKGSILTAP
jgi:putative transposase